MDKLKYKYDIFSFWALTFSDPENKTDKEVGTELTQ